MKNRTQIPYAGYKKALSAIHKNEHLMGYGMLQGLIIDTLTSYLKLALAQQGYRVLGLEIGLHIDKNNNFSLSSSREIHIHFFLFFFSIPGITEIFSPSR